MSKSNLVAREDINPIDSTLETVEQLLNDIERQFLMNVTFSSDQEMVVRILRHLRSTLMYYALCRAPVPPAAGSKKETCRGC